MSDPITKDDPRFSVMLDASDPDFVEQLRSALGIKPGETVQFITPQFDRTDGRVITYIPRTTEEYAALPTYSEETLRKMGCQKWDEEDGVITWLFPREWYSFVPAGLEVVNIFGEKKPFVPGQTDNDVRFGALSFGFQAAA